MLDHAQHPAQLRRVLVAGSAADPAELERAQGVALRGGGAVGRAHLLHLDRGHHEPSCDSGASPPPPVSSATASAVTGSGAVLPFPFASSAVAFSAASASVGPRPRTSPIEIPRSFATFSGLR